MRLRPQWLLRSPHLFNDSSVVHAIIRILAVITWTAAALTASAQPKYQIFDIGVIQKGDTASQGFEVSPNGIAVGRSIGNNTSQAFTWTVGGGIVGLPNLAGRNHAVSNSANNSGLVVGTAATTLFGSNRLPVIWQNGVVSQLPLPAGETLGDATGVNASGIAVGSVDGGSFQQGVIYNGGSATVITQTTTTGCFFVTAFGINDSGRIVGFGIDPNNAARNVGIVYDIGSANAFEVGALPGLNGALAFGVSNNGHVVGSSMLNQGSGTPFIYSDALGIQPIPLAAGTSQGSARAVNSAGWVVGQDSSAFSIPFLWDGTTTYRIADLLPPGSGWDLDMNTSSSALGISDNGVIVGTGLHNGETHAYALVPAGGTPTPTPSPTATPTSTPLPPIDIEVTMFDGPDPLHVGESLTYTITVFNSVPDTALNVTMTDTLPATVTFMSAQPSQGECNGTTTITCDLGTIQGSSKATVLLVVTPTQPTKLINTASAPFPGDPNPNNNSATVATTVLPAGTPTPTPTSTPTPTPTPSASPAGQPLNLSTRMRVLTDADVGIGGFIITGTDAKTVLLRGIGPSLGNFGVPDPLLDPVMELHGPKGFTTVTNDNWKDTQQSAIKATGLPPSNDFESAILATLDPGNYTAILKGKNNGVGVGLVEAYDLDQPPAAAKLGNISTRAFVGTGSDIMIAGFILGPLGAGDDTVIVRGIGPSLAQFGVPNPLANPTLELRDGNGMLVRSNNDWQDDSAQAAIINAAGLAPTEDVESAIAATLPRGQYTVSLAGLNNGTGAGLVEVYDLGSPPP